MKRGFFLTWLGTLFVFVFLTGCTKKEDVSEYSSNQVAMDVLISSKVNATNQNTTKQNATLVSAVNATSQMPKVEDVPLPPQGPFRPSVREIQTALKNTGYYRGAIDGKAGPLTRKAIMEFQKNNGLVVDGKVGPKTWAVLSRYLTQVNATNAGSPAD